MSYTMRKWRILPSNSVKYVGILTQGFGAEF